MSEFVWLRLVFAVTYSCIVLLDRKSVLLEDSLVGSVDRK